MKLAPGPMTRYQIYKARYLAEGRCVHCGAKLPDGSGFSNCGPCLDRARARSRLRPSQAKPPKATKWDAIDAAEACAICELRGDHVCLPPNATVFAENRSGADPVFRRSRG